MRVVLDANLLVSSLLVEVGPSAKALDAWRLGQYDLVVSPALVAELRHTLGYERIRRKYAITGEKVEALINLLQRRAVNVDANVNLSGAVPADPDDEAILACAVDGQADLIVSGDRHLLDLGSFQGISILAPRAFLELLAGG